MVAKWPTSLVLVLAALAAAADDRPLNDSLLCGDPCRCRQDTKLVACRLAAFDRVPAAAIVANVPAVKKL